MTHRDKVLNVVQRIMCNLLGVQMERDVSLPGALLTLDRGYLKNAVVKWLREQAKVSVVGTVPRNRHVSHPVKYMHV